MGAPNIHAHTQNHHHTCPHTSCFSRGGTLQQMLPKKDVFSHLPASLGRMLLSDTHTQTGMLQRGLTGGLTWPTVSEFLTEAWTHKAHAYRQAGMCEWTGAWRGQLWEEVWVGRCSIKDIEREKQTMCKRLGHRRKKIITVFKRGINIQMQFEQISSLKAKRDRTPWSRCIKVEEASDKPIVRQTPADKNTEIVTGGKRQVGKQKQRDWHWRNKPFWGNNSN